MRIRSLLIACVAVTGLAVAGTASPAMALTVRQIPLESTNIQNAATDINLAGIIVGGTGAVVDGVFSTFGARWEDGKQTLVYPPGASSSWANAVNLVGDIGGGATIDGVGVGFVRRGGTSVLLRPPGAVYSSVVDLNERREALVAWQDSSQIGPPNGSHLSLWRNGTFTEITTPTQELAPNTFGGPRIAYLNTRGQVVAPIRPVGDTGPGNATLWQAGRFTTILTGGSKVTALSELGHVVGARSGETGTGPAFSWYSGRLTELGGPGSEAFAVNELGQVAGSITPSPGVIHAALWTGGRLTDLGTFGGTRSFALGINNLGQVTGSAQTDIVGPTGYVSHPFVWQRGTMTDLTPGSEVSSGAGQITDTGFIRGSRSVSAGWRVYSQATAWWVSPR